MHPTQHRGIHSAMPVLDNQRHERFAQLVATKGKNDLQAYQEAFECDYEAAQSSAYRMRENVGILNRIKQLQEAAAGKSVLSLAEKRAFLAQVVRTPIGEVDERSTLAQSLKVSKDGDREIKMVGKLEALTLDAKLAGELVQHSTLDVRLGVFGPTDGRPVIDV